MIFNVHVEKINEELRDRKNKLSGYPFPIHQLKREDRDNYFRKLGYIQCLVRLLEELKAKS